MMNPIRLRRRVLGLGAAIALTCCIAPGLANARTAARGPVLVAPPSVDPMLDSVAQGLAAWVRQRIASTGLATISREAVRTRAPNTRADALSPEQVLALAKQLGAAHVVFPDLRFTSGQVEVRLRLVETTGPQLVAAPRSAAPLHAVGEACEESAARLLAALGVASRAALPPQADELAAAGRALQHHDRGELYRAWREVEHKLSPTAVATREEIVRAATSANAPARERSRVLAAAGEPGRAWTLIERDVRREVARPQPDRQLLLAAAEVEIARTNPREARRYVEMLLRTGAEDAEVQRTYARILMDQNDAPGAHRALARAARLDPTDSATFERLAEFEAGDRQRRAELLLRAGQNEALRLNIHRAESLLDRAAETAPAVAAESWRSRGELRGRLGRAAESLTAFRKAVAIDGDDAASHRGIGDAQRALGHAGAAQQAYSKALVLDPDDSDTLNALGAVHLEGDRAVEAVPLLRRALKIEPEDAVKRRNLAQALRATGELEAALKVLKTTPVDARRHSAENLRLAAEIHSQLGQQEAARDTLLAATRIEPFDPDTQNRLADAYEATGDADRAARAREFTALLLGEAPEPESLVPEEEIRDEGGSQNGPALDEIVASFASQTQGSRDRRVVQLGIRDVPTWRGRAYTWLHPRRPDVEGITRSLEAALARSFVLTTAPVNVNPVLAKRIDRLYAFGEQTSLDADGIATLNQAFDTRAVFVTRLDRAPEPPGEAAAGIGACADPERFAIEIRMLSGQHPDVVSILANQQCIATGLRSHGAWNERALAIYGTLCLLMLIRIIRGWGRVEVSIKLPPKTKGFFAIRVSKSEDEVPTEKTKTKTDTGRLKKSLRSLSRYERHMVGRQTLFRWIPARQRSYHVTVKGPLMDATGEEIIGHFLETQKIRVKRGKTAELEYDFCPQESGVEIRVQHDGVALKGAQIALRGDTASVRYARDGSAIIPLGEGEHRILVGGGDRVAEYRVNVESLGKSVRVLAELSDENALVFKGCAAAIEPFLSGDYRTAAVALEAAGLSHEAHLMRASLHQQLGSAAQAADELEAAGQLEEAAEMRARGDDMAGSARLFEQAGEHDRAGDAYRAAGDIAAAARCYQAAYDFDNALECYREIGDDANSLEILEKTGEFFDAGCLAGEIGDPDRALANFQQVDVRDANYGDACQRIANVLETRGDFDVAADKLEEALRCAGSRASAGLHERHAELLAKAGHAQKAIDAYQSVRRIEPQRRDLCERIAELERGRSECRSADEPVESRYEILGELGRGAMGVVFKARDKNLGRVVALKRLPDNLRDHPTAVALFKREAQAAAALNHRNIVTLFDAGEENGTYFITMELLEGVPLNQILKKHGKLSVGDAARLGIQIAAGLKYAQDQRIVHRDIKAGNLFFTRDRTVKIMDFGLAKTIEEVRKSSTMIGGTPYYMAPEQAVGDELDHRADLYAFGVTLYQLVAGTVPFREGDLIYHHRHTPPPDPRTHAPHIPAAMAEIILQLLEKEPDDRPRDAAEVGKRLQAVLKEVSGSK
jgi:tetratricopeptide (TPR) repeat protein